MSSQDGFRRLWNRCPAPQSLSTDIAGCGATCRPPVPLLQIGNPRLQFGGALLVLAGLLGGCSDSPAEPPTVRDSATTTATATTATATETAAANATATSAELTDARPGQAAADADKADADKANADKANADKPGSSKSGAAARMGDAAGPGEASAVAATTPQTGTASQTGTSTTTNPQSAADRGSPSAASANSGPGTAVASTADQSVIPASATATSPGTAGAPGAAPAATDPANKAPRKVELLIKERDFKIEGPDKALRVSYDDLDLLKVLNMEPVTADCVELMPKWMRGLEGQKVRIRGFMYPTFQETGIEQFVLARDNQICCFGRNPKLYDLIAIHMKSGTSASYIQNRPFDVVGTFRIELGKLDDGTLFGLYYVDGASLIE